jgi:hypothetical protein
VCVVRRSGRSSASPQTSSTAGVELRRASTSRRCRCGAT